MTVQVRQIRRNRGDRTHSSSHDRPTGRTQDRVAESQTRRPSSSGREMVNVAGRLASRLRYMHPAQAAVTRPSRASSARGLPLISENTVLTASAASITAPVTSTRRRVTTPAITLMAGKTPPAARASHTLPPVARMPE